MKGMGELVLIENWMLLQWYEFLSCMVVFCVGGMMICDDGCCGGGVVILYVVGVVVCG